MFLEYKTDIVKTKIHRLSTFLHINIYFLIKHCLYSMINENYTYHILGLDNYTDNECETHAIFNETVSIIVL